MLWAKATAIYPTKHTYRTKPAHVRGLFYTKACELSRGIYEMDRRNTVPVTKSRNPQQQETILVSKSAGVGFTQTSRSSDGLIPPFETRSTKHRNSAASEDLFDELSPQDGGKGTLHKKKEIQLKI